MENDQLKMIIEGALLAAGRSLDMNQLEKLFDEDLLGRALGKTLAKDVPSERDVVEEERPARDQIKAVLEDIATDCAGRGFELKQTGSGYRFQVRQELSQWVNKLWDEKPKKYSRALLETLALIAYRQPITRGDIEEIRGVSVSSEIIKSLLEREWVRVVGHRDVPGRPALYATTKQFLDYFSLKSLEQLPALNEIKDIEEINPELALDVAQQLVEKVENGEDKLDDVGESSDQEINIKEIGAKESSFSEETIESEKILPSLDDDPLAEPQQEKAESFDEEPSYKELPDKDSFDTKTPET